MAVAAGSGHRRRRCAMSSTSNGSRASSIPLFMPPRAEPAGVRATPRPSTPFYRIPLRAVESRVHRGPPADALLELWRFIPRPDDRDGAWPGLLDRLGETKLAGRAISFRSTTRCTARNPVCREPRRRPRPRGSCGGRSTTAIRSTGRRLGQTASFYYPNSQDAATLWYHDHTMGINRLNLYAGLMGVYLIRDEADDALWPAVGRP